MDFLLLFVAAPPEGVHEVVEFGDEALGKAEATHGVARDCLHDRLKKNLFPGLREKATLPALYLLPHLVEDESKQLHSPTA